MATLIAGIGRVVSREKIIDSVWEVAPRTARAQVHSAISGIRKTLSSCGIDDGVETQGTGYLLTVPRISVDLYAATDDLEKLIRVAATDGPSTTLADRIRDTVARIAVSPFPDVDARWATMVRERVAEQVLTAREVRLGMEIELGRARASVEDLVGLAVLHPDRATLGALSMRALWAAGRRPEALDYFHRTRRRTVDRFGIEPDVRLREVYQEILDADGAPGPAPPREAPARVQRKSTVPRMLPPLVSRTVGRHLDLAFLLENVPDPVERRWEDPPTAIVITGYAGVGKSQVAQHLCRELAGRFPRGQLYADLGGSSGRPRRPEDAMRDFLRALGAEPPHPETSADELRGLYRSVAGDRPLLVLLEDVSRDVDIETLVPPGLSSLIVATSRSRLGGGGGRGVRIDLQLPGVDDLVEMLAMLIGRDRVAAEPMTARALVHWAGLLPAAVASIAAELDARPHRGLKDAVDAWSAEQTPLRDMAFGGSEVARRLAGSTETLSAPAGRLLETLADSDEDGWPTWVAEQLVDGTPAPGRELIDELVRARLLDVVPGDEERLVFAPLIRAAVRRGSGGVSRMALEWPGGWRRVLGGWLHLVDCALAGCRLPLQRVWIARASRNVLTTEISGRVRDAGRDWVRSMREPLLGAMRIAAGFEPATCLELALAASELFEDLGDFAAWAECLEYAGAAASVTLSAEDRAGFLLVRGRLALARRDHDEARADLEMARRLLGRDADRWALAHIEVRLGWLFETRGDGARAETAYRNAIAALSSYAEQRTTVVQVLHRLGSVLIERGEVGEASMLAERAYELAVEAGSRKQVAQACLLVGAVHLARDERTDAERVFGEILSTARTHRDLRLEAHALRGLAGSHAAGARIESATELLEQAVRLARADDDRYLLAHLLRDQTVLLDDRRDAGSTGQHEDAIALFERLAADVNGGASAVVEAAPVATP